MSLPPTSIAAPALFLALTAIPRPFRIVDFPRCMPGTKDPVGRVALVVLSQEEAMQASARAEEITRRLLRDSPKNDEVRRGYDDVYMNAAAVEVLWRACRVHDDVDRKLFPAPEEIRKNLSPDEVGSLMFMYLKVSSELGPIASEMGEEEYKAWVTRIAEGGSSYPLGLLSSEMQSHLVISMASQLRNYWMATSSPGAPQDTGNQSDSSEPAASAEPSST